MRILVDSGSEEETSVVVVVVVDLRGLKRPFPALKALDMDEIIRTVLEALGAGAGSAGEGAGASPK